MKCRTTFDFVVLSAACSKRTESIVVYNDMSFTGAWLTSQQNPIYAEYTVAIVTNPDGSHSSYSCIDNGAAFTLGIWTTSGRFK